MTFCVSRPQSRGGGPYFPPEAHSVPLPHGRYSADPMPSYISRGDGMIVPTWWVFGGRHLCCLICAHFVSGRGGMWGRFRKPLKRASWNTLGLHVVLTTCLRFSSVLDTTRVACCLFLSTGLSAYKFTPRAIASPDAPQKPLVHKRAHSGGVKWVQVSRTEPSS